MVALGLGGTMFQSILDLLGDATTSTVVRTVVALLAIPSAIVGMWSLQKWLRGKDVHSQLNEVDDKLSRMQPATPLQTENARVTSEALIGIDRFLRLEMIPIISSAKHLEPQRDFRSLLQSIQRLQALKSTLTNAQTASLESLIANLERRLNGVIGALREAAAIKATDPKLQDTAIKERVQLQQKIDDTIAAFTSDSAAFRSSIEPSDR